MKALGYANFLSRFIYKGGMPVQLIFFVTSKCNCRCRHCFYWQEINSDTNELTIDEIEKISKNKFNLIWLSLTGGEPFLREDLADIALMFYKNSVVKNISIPTNGQLKEEIIKTTRIIAEKSPNAYISIIFSFDGLRNTHNFIRGSGTFETAVENFQMLKSMQSKFPNLGIAAQITCTAENQTEVRPLYAYLRDKLEPNNITINLVRGDLKYPEMKNIDIKYYSNLIEQIKSDRYEGRLLYYNSAFSKLIVVRNFLTYKLISEVFKQNKFISPCYAGYLNTVISETGNVYPCEKFEFEMGNLRECDYDFKKIWYSSRANNIRNYIKRSKCFCTYECAMSANVLFNPRFYPRMLIEMLKV